MDDEIDELHRQTRATRAGFLQAEVQTCFTALEIAQFELSEGRLDVVERELSFVARGMAAIRRTLASADAALTAEILPKLAALESLAEAMRRKVREKSR